MLGFEFLLKLVLRYTFRMSERGQQQGGCQVGSEGRTDKIVLIMFHSFVLLLLK